MTDIPVQEGKKVQTHDVRMKQPHDADDDFPVRTGSCMYDYLHTRMDTAQAQLDATPPHATDHHDLRLVPLCLSNRALHKCGDGPMLRP